MRLALAWTLLPMVWPLLANQASGASLQPTAQWAIDYGDTQCTAARSFRSPSGPIVLGIVPTFWGDTYKLVVSVSQPGPAFAHEEYGSVDLGGGKIKTWLLHYGGKGVNLSDYEFRVSPVELEQARTATVVDLRSDSGVSFEFALSDMPALLDGLQKCSKDLQQYWTGSHPVGPLSRPARGDIRSIFSSTDYPTEALAKGQGGTAQFELLIDETGRVARCDVVHQSGAPILDVMGCQVIMEKLRFTPASDGNGKPVRDTVTTPPIVWRADNLPVH